MKKNLFNLVLLAAIIGLVACDSDDKDAPIIETTISTDGIYMINEGNYNSGNKSTLSYYNIKEAKPFSYKDANGATSEDIFAYQNNIPLGSGAQDILIYGSKMYISVTTSDRIYVTDLNAKLLEYTDGKSTIIDSDKSKGLESPRSLIAHNGYVYASYYSGGIAKIDTTDMKIVATVASDYSKLDEMTVVNNKLYAIESQDPHDRVAVVNLNTFKLEDPIKMSVVNPYRIASNKSGNILVLSMSPNWDSKNTLTHIKPNGERIITETNAGEMCLVDNKLLLVSFTWGEAQTTELSYYDIAGEKIVKESILDLTNEEHKKALNSLYKISIDPNNQDIYVSSSNFTTSSNMLIFSQTGKYKSQFSTGGIGTAKAYFVSKKD